jgi:hypothetical protein
MKHMQLKKWNLQGEGLAFSTHPRMYNFMGSNSWLNIFNRLNIAYRTPVRESCIYDSEVNDGKMGNSC